MLLFTLVGYFGVEKADGARRESSAPPRGGNMEESRPTRQYSDAEIKEENKRIKQLRRLVDFSLALIAQAPMPLEEAQQVFAGVRQHALRLFPGKEETFDLIYTPRFRRLIAEKFGLL